MEWKRVKIISWKWNKMANKRVFISTHMMVVCWNFKIKYTISKKQWYKFFNTTYGRKDHEKKGFHQLYFQHCDQHGFFSLFGFPFLFDQKKNHTHKTVCVLALTLIPTKVITNRTPYVNLLYWSLNVHSPFCHTRTSNLFSLFISLFFKLFAHRLFYIFFCRFDSPVSFASMHTLSYKQTYKFYFCLSLLRFALIISWNTRIDIHIHLVVFNDVNR